MPCSFPITGYRRADGSVTFKRSEGYVDRQVTVKCGRCFRCRLEHSRQWAMRIVHEASEHAASSFVTLTYDDRHLPVDGSLDVRHWQLFAKRLRKRVGRFRFYHCGEYGEQNGRPHYHACLFGVDFRGDRRFYKSVGQNQLFTSELLEDTWGKGFCPIGDVDFESAAYVSGYVTKKLTGDRAEEYGLRKAPYSTMSRRPGIGRSWIERWADQVYPRDEVVVRGRVMRPPKYYDEVVLSEDERKRLSAVRSRFVNPEDQTPERRETIEYVKAKRARRFAREPGRRM